MRAAAVAERGTLIYHFLGETNNFKILRRESKRKKTPTPISAAFIGGDQDAKNMWRKKLFKLFDDKKMNYFVSRAKLKVFLLFI
jgi:hypothetical protein